MNPSVKPPAAELSPKTRDFIDLEERYGAHNYHPLDLVIEKAEGVWLYDVEGNRYLDCLSAYSAVNQGHCHPRLMDTMVSQAHKVTLTSRAFRNDQLPVLCKMICDLTGMDMVLPMNSGAEAVETAIKAARKWGYKVKGIPENQAEIIVCTDNFHGRTTTIISCSTEPQYRDGFGPFTPGFKVVPYGDLDALRNAITPNTCGFLIEPIQGEAGIMIPPAGYVGEATKLCQENNVLVLMDEIQTGLGRTGKLFCYKYDGVEPDLIIIGKALSGGFYPVSAVVSSKDILGVFNPGDHGSTFGGNPLACAIAKTALQIILDEDLVNRSATLGSKLLGKLQGIDSPVIKEVRGKGLMIGIELDRKARSFCEALKERGMLCKETHDHVIRIAPPLVIAEPEVDWAFEQLKEVLTDASLIG